MIGRRWLGGRRLNAAAMMAARVRGLGVMSVKTKAIKDCGRCRKSIFVWVRAAARRRARRRGVSCDTHHDAARSRPRSLLACQVDACWYPVLVPAVVFVYNHDQKRCRRM